MLHLPPAVVVLAALGAAVLTPPALAQNDAQQVRQELDPRISVEARQASNFVEVEGVRMHYLEAGSGDPILLLHGNPTSSYLWRNVIPFLEGRGRVIAPDLIGFGRSDKPALDYTFQTHYRFLTGFIEALDLQNVTVVAHDWGSALGLTYARLNESNVRAAAFMEAIVPPAFPMRNISDFGPFAETFRAFRDAERGPTLLIEQNVFIEQLLPSAVIRPLRELEMAAYRAPFLEPASRLPIYRWPNELPIAGEPARNADMIAAIGTWLQSSDLPKLLIYFEPGALIPPETAAWMQANYRNLQIRYGGAGLHYVQEDQPVAIGRHVSDWLADLDR